MRQPGKRGVVVVVGGSRGFGLALAQSLPEDGWLPLTGARTAPADPELADRHHDLDVTDSGSVVTFRDWAEERADGAVNAVVYCAASSSGVGRAWELPYDEIDDLFATTIYGLFRVTAAFIPAMRDQGRGTVLVVGSRAARETIELLSAYGAAKAALEHYVRCLAFELRGSGVTANILGIAAESALAREHAEKKAAIRGTASSHSPLPHLRHSVGPARLLLAPEARLVSGQLIEALEPGAVAFDPSLAE